MNSPPDFSHQLSAICLMQHKFCSFWLEISYPQLVAQCSTSMDDCGRKWSREHKARGQGHKRIQGQGHKRKCSPPPKKVFKIFIQAIYKILTIQKIVLSSSRDRAIFEDLRLGGQGLQNVSLRTPSLIVAKNLISLIIVANLLLSQTHFYWVSRYLSKANFSQKPNSIKLFFLLNVSI